LAQFFLRHGVYVTLVTVTIIAYLNWLVAVSVSIVVFSILLNQLFAGVCFWQAAVKVCCRPMYYFTCYHVYMLGMIMLITQVVWMKRCSV